MADNGNGSKGSDSKGNGSGIEKIIGAGSNPKNK